MPVQEERSVRAPVAEGGALTQETEGLDLSQQGRLHLECVGRRGRGRGPHFGLVGLQQHLAERLGIKGILVKARVIPRIHDQQFLVLKIRRLDDAAMVPILDDGAVRVAQDIVVGDPDIGRRGCVHPDAGLPEIRVQIFQGKGTPGSCVAG